MKKKTIGDTPHKKEDKIYPKIIFRNKGPINILQRAYAKITIYLLYYTANTIMYGKLAKYVVLAPT
jgi:hypothetical protein